MHTSEKIIGIIPARYASTRFPGKPLADIAGKSMIQRVYEQASKPPSLSSVVVATDDTRIAEHVAAFGGTVVMTSASHQSGTDRCFFGPFCNNSADIVIISRDLFYPPAYLFGGRDDVLRELFL